MDKEFEDYLHKLQSLEDEKKRIQTSLTALEIKISQAKQDLQEACTHEDIRTESFYNYHHSVEEYRDWCNVCGKRLRFY